MSRIGLLSCLSILLGGASLPAAETDDNLGFENGDKDGWILVHGRSEFRVVPTRGFFNDLSKSDSFLKKGGWEGHPVAASLNRDRNKFLLWLKNREARGGFMTASYQSSVVIEAGKQYTVSVAGRRMGPDGGPCHLNVSCVRFDYSEIRIATDVVEVPGGALFEQSVTFAAEEGEDHVGKPIVLTARWFATKYQHLWMDNAEIKVGPIDPKRAPDKNRPDLRTGSFRAGCTFEDGTATGWTFLNHSGKEVKAGNVTSAQWLNDSLRKSKQFWQHKDWMGYPLAKELNVYKNRYLLEVDLQGRWTAIYKTGVTIEPGRQYTVSVLAKSLIGGAADYFLDVFYLEDDGTRRPLGRHQVFRRGGMFFKQSVQFTTEAAQPYVGKKLGLAVRYYKKNAIDNAIVQVEPIDGNSLAGLVQGLPLVDTVDKDGRPRFSIRGYEDFRYTKPLEEAGTLENAGAPFPAMAQFIPKDNPEYTLYDLDGLTLRSGEGAAVTLSILGVRAYAGFAVDGNVFLLGRHGNRKTKRDDGTNMNPFRTPDYMMYIAKVSETLGPETLVIAREGDRIHWFACGRKGAYTIRGVRASPKLSLFAHGECAMGQLRKGRLSKEIAAYLDSFIPAPRHPFGRPNTPGLPGSRRPQIATGDFIKTLSTDLNAPLSDREIDAMMKHVAGANGLGFGTNADPLFSLPGMYVPAKIFLITRRREVIDHMLRISDPAITIRNGFEVDGVKYGVRIGGGYNRYVNIHDFCPFPYGGFQSEADRDGAYFNERHEYTVNHVSRSSDPKNSRMIPPSLAAYCISLHPEIWDQVVPGGDPCRLGRTYRQRAERYLRELALNYTDYKDCKMYNFQTEYIWDSYTEFFKYKEELAERVKAWEKTRDASGQPTFYLSRYLKERGAHYAYYELEESWSRIPDLPELARLTPTEKGTIESIRIHPNRQGSFAYRYTGFINVEEGGCEVALASDDGSMLYVGNEVVIDNNGRHGMTSKIGKLPAGIHPVTVTYFEARGRGALRLGYVDERRSKKAIETFLENHPRPQSKERRAGINRFVSAVSCAGFAANAAGTFGDRESMKAIDACGEKMLKAWFNTYQFYAPGHDGQYLNQPDKWYRAWAYQPNAVNPEARDYDASKYGGWVRAEDRAHANFTAQGLSLLHESGRYEHIMTRKRMTDLARTFNEMVLIKYNVWRPMPRAAKHGPQPKPQEGLGPVRFAPLLMFTPYNAELKQKVIKGMVESTGSAGVIINRLILAEMRARKHNQIPARVVD